MQLDQFKLGDEAPIVKSRLSLGLFQSEDSTTFMLFSGMKVDSLTSEDEKTSGIRIEARLSWHSSCNIKLTFKPMKGLDIKVMQSVGAVQARIQV